VSDTALVQARGITKRFAGVVALDDASLAAEAGEVTCLLGDNGAGKSTLIKVLAGVHPPTSGAYLLDGAEVRFGSPREALGQGIATVYQDLAMVPLMSVWRNFFLGSEITTGAGPLRRLDAATMRRVALEQLAAMGVELTNPEQPVESLSGGQRQAVAIARAVHFGARVLILDEPTAALGVRQSEHVLELVRRAADRGVAVVLVTHNPSHALPVGDRFVVLRRGRVVADRARADIGVDELTRLMGGGGA
jgi:simple sugar transport system ATP-binding protein